VPVVHLRQDQQPVADHFHGQYLLQASNGQGAANLFTRRDVAQLHRLAAVGDDQIPVSVPDYRTHSRTIRGDVPRLGFVIIDGSASGQIPAVHLTVLVLRDDDRFQPCSDRHGFDG